MCLVARRTGYARLLLYRSLLLYAQTVPPYRTIRVGLLRHILFVCDAKACPPFRKFNLLVCHDSIYKLRLQRYCFFFISANFRAEKRTKMHFFDKKRAFSAKNPQKVWSIQKKAVPLHPLLREDHNLSNCKSSNRKCLWWS